MATDRRPRGVGSPLDPKYSARKGVPSVASHRGENEAVCGQYQSDDKRYNQRALYASSLA